MSEQPGHPIRVVLTGAVFSTQDGQNPDQRTPNLAGRIDKKRGYRGSSKVCKSLYASVRSRPAPPISLRFCLDRHARLSSGHILMLLEFGAHQMEDQVLSGHCSSTVRDSHSWKGIHRLADGKADRAQLPSC
jgi:hypothetical protein